MLSSWTCFKPFGLVVLMRFGVDDLGGQGTAVGTCSVFTGQSFLTTFLTFCDLISGEVLRGEAFF